MTGDEDTGVRLDLFLTRTRLIMPRGMAKRACDNGIVAVNGNRGKPATMVRVGDLVEIRFTDQDLTVCIERLPGKSVRKADARAHYRVIADKRYL